MEEGLEIPFCQKGIREEYPNEPLALDPPLADMTIQGQAVSDVSTWRGPPPASFPWPATTPPTGS